MSLVGSIKGVFGKSTGKIQIMQAFSINFHVKQNVISIKSPKEKLVFLLEQKKSNYIIDQ